MRRPHFVTMGPAIPVVEAKAFSRVPRGMLEAAWEVCGPSAARNLKGLEIWQVIAAAYVEGLQHGYSMGRDPTIGGDQGPTAEGGPHGHAKEEHEVEVPKEGSGPGPQAQPGEEDRRSAQAQLEEGRVVRGGPGVRSDETEPLDPLIFTTVIQGG